MAYFIEPWITRVRRKHGPVSKTSILRLNFFLRELQKVIFMSVLGCLDWQETYHHSCLLHLIFWEIYIPHISFEILHEISLTCVSYYLVLVLLLMSVQNKTIPSCKTALSMLEINHNTLYLPKCFTFSLTLPSSVRCFSHNIILSVLTFLIWALGHCQIYNDTANYLVW